MELNFPEGLEAFLASAGWGEAAIEPLAGDASFLKRFEAEARKWLAGPVTCKDGRTFNVDDLSAFLMDTTYSATGVRSLPVDLDKIIAGDLTPVAEIAEDPTSRSV